MSDSDFKARLRVDFRVAQIFQRGTNGQPIDSEEEVAQCDRLDTFYGLIDFSDVEHTAIELGDFD